MSKARPCEEEILKTVRTLPDEALPRVLKLVTVVRDECRTANQNHAAQSNTNHERTRTLVATSKTNWAQALITERDDRL